MLKYLWSTFTIISPVGHMNSKAKLSKKGNNKNIFIYNLIDKKNFLNIYNIILYYFLFQIELHDMGLNLLGLKIIC